MSPIPRCNGWTIAEQTELVQQRDSGGDLQPGDLVVWYPLQVLDQGPQRVAVRDDQHAAAGQQIRNDRVVPVRQQPRGDVAQGFAARLHLWRKHGVAGIVQLELPGFRGERRRGDVVRATPEPKLPVAVLPKHLVLVPALQRSVVPAVEPPRAAHRDPVAVRGRQGEVSGADRPLLQGRVHEGGQHAVLGEHRSGPGRLGFPVGGQVGVLPAGEDASRVPLALPVPQQDQAHRLGHHVPSAARPGRVLPWMNSRLAPPPVET